MNGYLIAVIVIFVLLLAIMLLFIVNVTFVGIFSRKLSEHNKALTILLTQKYEGFENIFGIYSKNNIRVDDRIVKLFKSIDIDNFEDLDNDESLKDRNNLSLLKQELNGLVKSNKNFLKNEEFQLAIKMLNSIDEQFRTICAAYNADVIGFNYWINFKLFKYLFLFNHVGKKELIS